MTVKEIAVAVGKAERTVQTWAKDTGAKIASIGAKIASAQKTGIAVDYAITSNDANAFINETWSGVLIEQFPHFDYVTLQVRTLRGTAVVQFSLVGFADLYPTN